MVNPNDMLAQFSQQILEDNEEMSMESSTESLGPLYQCENKFNNLLPYVDELDEDARNILIEIKGQLGRSVMLRRLQPDCYMATVKLHMFLNIYSLRFSKEDHITFIKLLYELIIIPDLEPNMVHLFSSTLIFLTKKKDLIAPNELELPWRPLFDMTVRISKRFGGGRVVVGMERFFGAIKKFPLLLRQLKVYFPVSATQEILDELRPKLCPFDILTMERVINALEYFLPVHLAPKDHVHGFKLWFDEFMNIWEVHHNGAQWEDALMALIAQLAENNIGYIDWEPYIPIMFTRFVRSLNLPVVYNKTKCMRVQKIDMRFAAVWIVSVLGNNSSGQMHLENFLHSIETYFHQANSGPWVNKLISLLQNLALQFISRLHKERFGKQTWETPIPDSHKLTDADIDAFVKALMPPTMMSMFGHFSVDSACRVLQRLATVRPNMVIPEVIERLYLTLDTVTEPHKFISAMMAVTSVARPMVQGKRNVNEGYTYNEGPSRVLPLLMSSLPGIDANDLNKSHVTFRLILAYAAVLPFIDCSKAAASELFDENDRIACEETSQFEDFILQFFDRIFSLIESSTLEYISNENHDSSRRSKSELNLEKLLEHVCTILLIRSSDEIFHSALHKLRKFVTERVLETKVSGPLAASLCHSFARVNGHETLRNILPSILQTIFDVLKDSDVDRAEQIDDKLLYPILLLSNIVETNGASLMPYIHTLMDILDKILHLKSREGSLMASRVLSNILKSLSIASQTNEFTYDGIDRNDPNYPHILNWGQGVNIDNLNISWYVPGEEEVSTMQYILNKYLPIEIEKIQEYCANDNSEISRQELTTALNIVNAIIGGCIDYLPIPPGDASNVDPLLRNFAVTTGIKGELRMPDGNNVRQFMTTLIAELQTTLLRKAEDDTKNILGIVTIWNVLLCGRCHINNDGHKKIEKWKGIKNDLKDELVKRERNILIRVLERVDSQHKLRYFARSYHLTNYHKFMMNQLFELATSRYATVRIGAQESIFKGILLFPFSQNEFKPLLLEMMSKDPVDHHELHKGLLYVLLGPKPKPLISTSNWSFLRSILPAIVAIKPSEKMSVIQLKNRLAGVVNFTLSTLRINVEVPDSCVKAAAELWNYTPKPLIAQPNECEITDEKFILDALGTANAYLYDNTLLDILNTIRTNCHWRQRLMGLQFIRDLAHLERSYPAPVVEYCFKALVHESLEERKIATVTSMFILRQQKVKYEKITIEVPEIKKKTTNTSESVSNVENFRPGIRPDNMWLQYNYEKRPLTEKQWNELRYVRDVYTGYYTWPKDLKVYGPSPTTLLDSEKNKNSKSKEIIDSFFAQSTNIDKLIKYNSIEERKGMEKINGNMYMLYKFLFRNHGIRHLEIFLPHLKSLIIQKQESSQRCAAEIISGLIRGSNHWPFDMIVKMWELLIPIIRQILDNIMIESLSFWKWCFAVAVAHRDPNRIHWLLECLMEEPESESTTSFAEVHRMSILQSVFVQQSWRVAELMQRFSIRLEKKLLANPFQNVRNTLGSLLTTIFHNDDTNWIECNPSIPRAKELLDRLLPRLNKFIDDFHNDENKELLSTRAHDISILKTIGTWMTTTILMKETGVLLRSSELLSILCQLENYEADDELAKICTIVLAGLSQALTLPQNMTEMMDALLKISYAPSWSTRESCLNFIEVFVFHNMGIIVSNNDWIKQVQEIVLRLIADERLEVREKAGRVLCGLLHCALLPDQEALLNTFKHKLKAKVNNNPDDLRLRHAGILGLCAFIQAHPYDVPKYMPSIFKHLDLCLNDPQPIPTTIRKTLGDFKRTHHDGWATHAQCFTEEQLGILQDLIAPPSYYA